MNSVDKKRNFLISFAYLALWIAIIFCILKYALPMLMPFVIAFGIAFMLKPLINKITDKTHWNRKPIAVIILILFYATLGTLLVFLGIRITVYVGNLLVKLPHFYYQNIEPLVHSFSSWFEDMFQSLDPSILNFLDLAGESMSKTISSILSAISSGALNMLSSIATNVPMFVVSFVLCIIASFFFVVDYYKITNFIVKQLSETMLRRLFAVKDFVINVLFKFARAYLILMSITFVEVSIGLLILGVEHAFLIAALTAVVDILPILGTGTVLIPWAIFNIFSGNLFVGFGLLIIYAVITIVRQILEPKVIGKQIGLYPLLTLICMFLGARFFGFWGMFGLPIIVTVIVSLNRSGEIKLFKE